MANVMHYGFGLEDDKYGKKSFFVAAKAAILKEPSPYPACVGKRHANVFLG